jgi:site-specific recombinase XerC
MSAPKPLREYLVPFLDFCEVQKGLADNTQRNYRQYLRVFFDCSRSMATRAWRQKD